jgi:hypothetical protein
LDVDGAISYDLVDQKSTRAAPCHRVVIHDMNAMKPKGCPRPCRVERADRRHGISTRFGASAGPDANAAAQVELGNDQHSHK